MIGWEEENNHTKRNVIIFMFILVFLSGYFAGYYVGTHRCPQEDSCGYSDHQWQPVEH
jgi:hypothetical protein